MNKETALAGTVQEIIVRPNVIDKFKHIYHIVTGTENGEAFYEMEKFHFLKQLNENQNIKGCSQLSLYSCFMDVAVSGLSFDPNAKQVYIVPYGNKAQLMISGYGELLLRQRQGQIKYADNPVIVYEGDEFSTGTKNGQYFVEHTAKYPRKSDTIIACYLRITRSDDTIDYKVITMEELEKLRKFSKSPNSKAWTDGLAGMIQAKCIKHAFRNYPKIRMGKASSLETQTEERESEDISYDDVVVDNNNTANIDDNSFANDTTTNEPKTITHTDIDDNF